MLRNIIDVLYLEDMSFLTIPWLVRAYFDMLDQALLVAK